METNRNKSFQTYRVSHFNLSMQLSPKIFVIIKDVSNKTCSVSNGTSYDDNQICLGGGVFEISM